MSRDPLRSNLIENLIFLELVKSRYNQGYEHQLYFYRDQHQNEVDFIFKTGYQLIPIEVKSAQTIYLDFFKGLKYFMRQVGDRVPKGYLVYTGEPMQQVENIAIFNYRQSTECLATAQ